MQLEVETTTEDVGAKETGSAGFFDGFFKALVGFEDFTVDIVVTDGRTHGETADDHAFDQGVRVVPDDIQIFKGTRLASSVLQTRYF